MLSLPVRFKLLNYLLLSVNTGALNRAAGAVMHHQRDVTLAEDDLKTAKAPISRLLSSLRTMAMNLLEGMNVKNMAAQLDNFTDKFSTLIQFFTQQMVL